MSRERFKRRPRKNLSTDAEYRGGATRNSEEDSVMGLERRGCIVQFGKENNRIAGGFDWTKQSHFVFPNIGFGKPTNGSKPIRGLPVLMDRR